MPNGILIVQSRPSSAEKAADYHRWYEETHLPEVLALEGFVSARRFESLDGESYLVIYEIDGDVEQAKAKLAAAQSSGSMTRPVGVQLNPPPSVQWFRQRSVERG